MCVSHSFVSMVYWYTVIQYIPSCTSPAPVIVPTCSQYHLFSCNTARRVMSCHVMSARVPGGAHGAGRGLLAVVRAGVPPSPPTGAGAEGARRTPRRLRGVLSHASLQPSLPGQTGEQSTVTPYVRRCAVCAVLPALTAVLEG